MTAREPLLSSGLRDRQLASNDLENSNTSTGHAPRPSAATRTRPMPTTAVTAAPSGLGLRDDRRNMAVTYAPSHERHIETCVLNPYTTCRRSLELRRIHPREALEAVRSSGVSAVPTRSLRRHELLPARSASASSEVIALDREPTL